MNDSRPGTDDGLVLGMIRAARGSRATGHVAVDLGDVTVEVPVVLVHGAAPGPRVAVTSGIHGAEYVSIAAHRRVAMELDPAAVRGSLVSVLVANPAAFAARSIYIDPLDGRNLNRVFPGDPAGSASQRLARWIHDAVMTGSDAFIDMHCGDMNEALVPFNGIEETGDPGIDERARAMAGAYGLDYLVVGPLPGSTTTAATALGMPALLAEVGGQGLWPAADVDRHAAGLRRTLAMLGLRDGSGDPPAGVQRRLGSDVWLRSGATGFWHPAVAVGDTVQAGDRVGEVQDAFGAPLEVVTASAGGVVLFLVTSLAMNAGDPLLALGA
ncbi:MAG TPA: succinylglutamate desuccinylase/aspartoacylase family protein [Candidatus Limnocylindrales bacterium]